MVKCVTCQVEFDNGGYIIVEMLKEVSCTEHFQVMDYGFGK